MGDLVNPQWWVSNTVAAAIGLALPALLGIFRARLHPLLSHAKGRVGRYFTAKRIKRLKLIKSIRFDSARINREIVNSGILLAIFILTAMGCVASFALAPTAVHESFSLALLFGAFAGAPMVLFEIAWLKSSSKVNDILKYRGKIKRHGRRLY